MKPMDGMNDMEGAGDTPGAADEAGAGDLSQGYCIEISVLPDGTFKVSGPEPLAAEAKEETGEAGSKTGEDFDGIAEALKGVIQIVKANPVGGDPNAQFDAGYKA